MRLEVEVDLDPGQAGGELVEGDHAGVRQALGDVPLDPLVRPLLDDLGLEPPVIPQIFIEKERVVSSACSTLSSGA